MSRCVKKKYYYIKWISWITPDGDVYKMQTPVEVDAINLTHEPCLGIARHWRGRGCWIDTVILEGARLARANDIYFSDIVRLKSLGDDHGLDSVC